MRLVLLIFIPYIFLNACYWGKTLDENKKIKIIVDFSPLIDNSISNVYINNSDATDYKKAFVDELNSSFSQYNITIIDDNITQADFTIVIENLYLKESEKSETVNDASSPYNGQSYNLIVCNVDVDFKLYQGEYSHNKLIDTYSINAEKEEKVTNNRNLTDYMFGNNKDNSEYRHKLLSDDIFITLCKKAGNRTCARASTKISKRIK